MIQLPASCEPGAPVDVTVYATDGVLDRRVRQVSSGFVLVDKTRPWIRAATIARPIGPYFIGDAVQFDVSAGDNHVVKSIVWEVQPYGVRDSIVAPPAGSDARVRIPIQSSWSGPVELRYFARDAVGLASDTIASTPGTVAIYASIERPTKSMAVEDAREGIFDEAVDLARAAVYLMQPGVPRIAVMSLASMTVVATIPLALSPQSIELTPSGDTLLVTFPTLGALGVVDLTRPDRRLELAPIDPKVDTWVPWNKPSSTIEVRALSNGKAFVVVPIDPVSRRLVEVDLATGAQRYRFDVGTGGAIGGGNTEGALLSRSVDGSVLSVRTGDCIQRYDTAADQFGPCVRPRTLGAVSSVDATGARFAIGPDVYDAAWRQVNRVEVFPAGTGWGSALTPDGREIFLPYAGGIVRASTTDGRILDRQTSTIRPSRVRVTADGRYVVAVGTSISTGGSGIAVIQIR